MENQDLITRIENLEYSVSQFNDVRDAFYKNNFAGSQGLTKNTTVQSGFLQSGNFATGVAGWQLTPTSAEFPSITVSGGTIKYGKTSFSDTVNAGYNISSSGFYFGSANDVTYIKYNIGTGLMTGVLNGFTIDGTSTIGGRLASTLATAIDASGHFADNAINTATSSIIGAFTFGVSGALQVGTYVNGVSGDLRISPNGILARDSTGATTFSINGTTGVAVLNGLVVGTNVGLGTAQDSSGVTTIIGNTVTTSFVNALNVNANTVSASIAITTPTITGGTFQTDAGSTTGIKMDSTSLRGYDAGGLVSFQLTKATGAIEGVDFISSKRFTYGENLTEGECVGFGTYSAATDYSADATWIDAYVDRDDQTTNFEDTTPMLLGTSTTDGSPIQIDGKRIYLKISVNQIPNNFLTATLKLYAASFNNATVISYEVYAVTSSWLESTISWAAGGGNAGQPTNDAYIWASGNIDTSSAFHSIDITNLMTAWKSGFLTNHGLVIVCTGRTTGDASQNSWVRITATEGVDKPKVTVSGLIDTGKVYKTSNNAPQTMFNFCGVARETANSGTSSKVQISGNATIKNGSSLDNNTNQYFTASGLLTSTPTDAYAYKAGWSNSTTTFLIEKGQKVSKGKVALSGNATTIYYTIPTYFRPAKIIFTANMVGTGASGYSMSSYGVATGFNSMSYQTTQRNSATTANSGTNYIYNDTAGGVYLTVEVVAIYESVTLLKAVYTGNNNTSGTLDYECIG